MKKVLLFLIFIAVGYKQFYAAHIIGGDVTYEFLGKDGNINTYRITFTMYRDSKGGGAEFDTDAEFGIYVNNGSSWIFVNKTARLSPILTEEVDPDTTNPCIKVPSYIGVERGVYEFTVGLEQSSRPYLIAYQRCCRNGTINNIREPGETGAVFSIEIHPNAQQFSNNSPIFNQFPPIVICQGEDINFDHSANDRDGDDIVYEFCAPLSAGGTAGATSPGMASDCDGVKPDPQMCLPPFDEVTFDVPNFTPFQPMAGNPLIQINPITGKITGVPTELGQYVVGVCAKEYRNGVLIGEIRRDFQFNVIQCENKVNAALDAFYNIDDQRYEVKLCGTKSLNLTNVSTDVSFIKSFAWEFYDGNDTIHIDSRNLVQEYDDYGLYNYRLFLNRDIEFDKCKDSVDLQVAVYPPVTSDFEYDYDTCVAGPIYFENNSFAESGIITGYEWFFDIDETSTETNPSYEFLTPGLKNISLITEDINGCKDTLVRDILYQPVPTYLVIEPTQFIGCLPADITFNNLSYPVDDTYDITWDFGDGGTSGEVSPTHTFTEEGIYTIDLEIVSPIGCETARTFPSWIEILPKPQADFSFSPENPNILEKEVAFFDESTDAISWQWDFNGERVAFDQNAVHTFQDSGLVYVSLLVKHESGCTDTLTKIIDVLPLTYLHFPNAFTPNLDGLNDEFVGVGFYEGLKSYHMTVWNRWGEKLFETTDPSIGWNGRKNNIGAEAPQDAYVYLVKYVGPRGNQESLKGNITLLR